MTVTTIGQLRLNKIMPEGFKNIDRPLNSKELGKVMTDMANSVPREVYVKTLKELTNFGFEVANDYGGVASAHLKDVTLPANLREMRNTLRRHVYQISQREDLDPKTKNKKIIEAVRKATPIIDKAIVETLKDSDNSFGLMVGSGVKGKPAQLRALVFGDLLTVDSKMRDIPYPTFRSYGEGVTPLQYWTASHGGRYGYIQVQKATADAGYFSKQTRGVVHRQIVTMEDCGRAKPYYVDADDDNAIGSLLFKEVKGKSGKSYPANTVITADILDDLTGKIPTRSAICCGAGDGVCSHCAGVRESGRLPDIGDAIGLNGINAGNEQITQMGLSSKHSGGESVGAKRIKRGFAAVEQFINMPENFVGGASVASVDGRVTAIKDAPQGGKNIHIGETVVYAPTGFEPTVKVGQHVEAGDLISEGMPNIESITQYKGLGAGRRAFVEALYDIMSGAGAGVPKKQLEPFARAYVDRVEITDPDGLQGWIYGDIASYNVLEKNWKPRMGAFKTTVEHAAGKYLELPELHYTIGTRITPSVVKELQEAGVRELTVHSKEPPFKPHMTSAKQFTAEDPDWLTALSGEGLTKSFLNHVQRTSTSRKGSTSYYPDLALIGVGDKPNLKL